ncbi:B-type flagellin [Zhongshania aliphaticivorans]|uniref:Flagellin n=1 Tax=Zhongshania aliphaticivorans TaxID=1470434 RepID=A0A5S9NLK8_9GAMM|nr:flagellin [Zhongshania aliphaticivorans]CAA0090829.1 B-type flagellin [Zhongshania aliphaticivorans]CAA0098324.1 B-type flagellin [Zhongshania aliphaticivorans]
MALSINTNVASLNAQRNLQKSQETLNTSLQRLSTGLRINSAKDDAAGLAISTRFTTQINGLNQAVRNANDGISLAQTGESALDEMTNNLQRIRELAVQSANATNSDSDRNALDAEVQQRLSEIDRISSQTSFNGSKILDGSTGNAQFQIGANVGETITLDLSSSTRLDSVGATATATSVSLAGSDEVPATSGSGVFDATSLLADFSSETVSFDVSDGTTTTAVTLAADYSGAGGIDDLVTDLGTALGADFAVTNDGDDITITSALTGAGTEVSVASFDADADGNTTDSAVTAFPAVTGTDGEDLVAAVAGGLTVDGDFSIAVGDADAVAVADGTYASTEELVVAINTALGSNGTAEANDDGTFTITSNEAVTFTGTAATTTAGLTDAALTGSLSGSSVLTVADSNDMIRRIDAALTTVSDRRSDFGAVQNRFESTITNLQTISENLSASRGRILDADFASETANLTKAQILQQAGTAILAQANSLPQAALSLLQ